MSTFLLKYGTIYIMKKETINGVPVLLYPELEKTEFIKHCFSTREGGVSSGIFKSMNLSFTRGDDKENVDENFRRIAAVMDEPTSNFVLSKQTHTTNVHTVTEKDAGAGLTRPRPYTDTDGLITNVPHLVLSCFFADCVPLYFIDTKKRAIGLSHSGWRGTAYRMGKVTIEKMKEVMRRKWKSDAYMVYFQAFTNTYASVDILRQKYFEAADCSEVKAIDIATRPDCLPEDVLDLLEELNRIKPVWVELGLQTVHEETAKYIRRGYPLSVFDTAVAELKKRNLEVIVHVILGLPNETAEDMLATVSYIAEKKVQGIKLQLLHILKGTDLAKEYEAGKVQVLCMEEYISIVCRCLSLLPEGMVVHRLTGDGDKKILIAPKWSADKKKVLNALRKAIGQWEK